MKSRSEEEKGAGIEEGRGILLSSSGAGWDFVMVAMAEGSSQGREMMVRAHLTALTHPVSFPFPFPFSPPHPLPYRICAPYMLPGINFSPLYSALPSTRAYYINIHGHDAPWLGALPRVALLAVSTFAIPHLTPGFLLALSLSQKLVFTSKFFCSVA